MPPIGTGLDRARSGCPAHARSSRRPASRRTRVLASRPLNSAIDVSTRQALKFDAVTKRERAGARRPKPRESCAGVDSVPASAPEHALVVCERSASLRSAAGVGPQIFWGWVRDVAELRPFAISQPRVARVGWSGGPFLRQRPPTRPGSRAGGSASVCSRRSRPWAGTQPAPASRAVARRGVRALPRDGIPAPAKIPNPRAAEARDRPVRGRREARSGRAALSWPPA